MKNSKKLNESPLSDSVRIHAKNINSPSASSLLRSNPTKKYDKANPKTIILAEPLRPEKKLYNSSFIFLILPNFKNL